MSGWKDMKQNKINKVKNKNQIKFVFGDDLMVGMRASQSRNLESRIRSISRSFENQKQFRNSNKY